jgi:Na+-transporting NADH:ubiquinone oxidoreductase subunit F
VRLSCQLKVRGDLSIVIPDELFGVRQHLATVAGLRDLTHDIKEVRLRLDDPPAIDFVAGQFIQFEVPPYELTDEPVYRAYSLASEPGTRGEIELEIRPRAGRRVGRRDRADHRGRRPPGAAAGVDARADRRAPAGAA